MNYDKIVQIVQQTKQIIIAESKNKNINEKGLYDYVTNVDIKVQTFLTRELQAVYPTIKMVAEEQADAQRGFESDAWILDPIDGTTNLIHDYNHSSVSLALCQNNEITFGIVYNPFTEELFTGYKGGGAYRNGNAIHVSDNHEMRASLIAVGTSPYRKEEAKKSFALFEKIYMDCQDIRRSGSAALDIAYVACGRTDAFFERHLSPWDYAAGSIILQEAGGSISDWNGAPIPLRKGSSIAATNGAIKDSIMSYLKNY